MELSASRSSSLSFSTRPPWLGRVGMTLTDKARARRLRLGHDPRLLTQTPTATTLNPGDDLHRSTSPVLNGVISNADKVRPRTTAARRPPPDGYFKPGAGVFAPAESLGASRIVCDTLVKSGGTKHKDAWILHFRYNLGLIFVRPSALLFNEGFKTYGEGP